MVASLNMSLSICLLLIIASRYTTSASNVCYEVSYRSTLLNITHLCIICSGFLNKWLLISMTNVMLTQKNITDIVLVNLWRDIHEFRILLRKYTLQANVIVRPSYLPILCRRLYIEMPPDSFNQTPPDWENFQARLDFSNQVAKITR